MLLPKVNKSKISLDKIKETKTTYPVITEQTAPEWSFQDPSHQLEWLQTIETSVTK